uniref:Uncharacterized protein n=1 Tax=Solanum tuberosum TaxID=4113 RepID=M1C4A5_SOLTU
MNKFAYRQNGFVSFREIDVSKGVVCPKPRRSGANERFNTNATLLQIKYVSLSLLLFVVVVFCLRLFIWVF